MLDGRSGELLIASRRPVRLRDDESDLVVGREQSLERGNGELRSAAKDELEAVRRVSHGRFTRCPRFAFCESCADSGCA